LFLLNARIERHVNDLGLVRERRIRDGYGHIAIHKVSKSDERDQDNADDESEQESHKWVQPPSFFIVLHETGGEAKRVGERPRDDGPADRRSMFHQASQREYRGAEMTGVCRAAVVARL